jgi:hypothetical protein
MENTNRGSGRLSRAEQFLIDDEKNTKRFRKFRERQQRNLADLKQVSADAEAGVLSPDHEKVMAECDRSREVLAEIMAENARLVAEEKAILNRSLITRISRAFKPPDASELAAEEQIKKQAMAREAQNRADRAAK